MSSSSVQNGLILNSSNFGLKADNKAVDDKMITYSFLQQKQSMSASAHLYINMKCAIISLELSFRL